MTGEDAVTSIVKFLKPLVSCPVYKFDDKRGVGSTYISVHHQVWVFGSSLNDNNIVNLNLHAPKLNSGAADRAAMDAILSVIRNYIPFETGSEEDDDLFLDGAYYCISSISSPIEDKADDTYFYNIRIKTVFNN